MIQFRKLYRDAVTPQRQTEGSAGFDLCYFTPLAETDAETAIIIPSREFVTIGTGLSVSLPETCVGIIKPRSGLAVKHGIDVLAGVIDSDYRGEIKVVLINHGTVPVVFNPGDRIAQLVVIGYERRSKVVTNLDVTNRGTGGFGSTGR